MADLDPTTAAALCRALERVLPLELRRPVVCVDISSRSERWDIEARDRSGALLRRVSHTQVVPERMAMAGAELRDVRHALDGELRQLGVSGFGVSLHGRRLPTTRRERQTLGEELAQRVRDHIVHGTPIIEDPMVALRAGRHPYADPVAAALSDVTVHADSTRRAARVLVSGDDRLGCRIPELHEEVLPAVATKRQRHGHLTPELTLVVETVLSEISRAAIVEARQGVQDHHRSFKSVYVGRLKGSRFTLKRLY